MFRPNAGYPNVRVFLANSKGDTIDDFWIVERVPEYDLAIGRISRRHPAVRVCPLQTKLAAGDKVRNIGFPTDQGVSDYKLRIEGQKLIVQRISMKPAVQQGTVKAIKKATVRANDVNIQDKMVAILDYSSRVGFSGGPLVSRSTGKVVGLMCFVIPKEYDDRTPVAAIRMADIKPIIEKKGQPADEGGQP
jgi:S1-C subfamily serine protease